MSLAKRPKLDATAVTTAADSPRRDAAVAPPSRDKTRDDAKRPAVLISDSGDESDAAENDDEDDDDDDDDDDDVPIMLKIAAAASLQIDNENFDLDMDDIACVVCKSVMPADACVLVFPWHVSGRESISLLYG